MTPLEPGQLWVMRIRGAITALGLLAAALSADLLLSGTGDIPFGLLSGAVFLAILYPCLISPGRQFRAWGYRIEPDELHVAHGVWTQIRTVVPFGRVQHIDVSQGPIERRFGVTRLVVHTAGTADSEVILPGLSRDTAEALRDEIRAQIRLEPK